MFFSEDRDVDPSKNPISRLFGRLFPVTQFYDRDNFFTKVNGKKHATPLLLVLIAVETTDIIFATDSIPAVLAILPNDPQKPYNEFISFIAYSSNIFAVLGLRALYFALAGIMELFHYLHYGLSLILCFIGAKIIYGYLLKINVLPNTYQDINTWVSLGVVGSILLLSIVFSLIFKKKETPFPQHAEPKKAGRPEKPF
jgi:tellurite resistance protein TerC